MIKRDSGEKTIFESFSNEEIYVKALDSII